MKEILNQIQSDLSELQNHPDDLSYEQLVKFYDRMCANVTDYETFCTNPPKTIEVDISFYHPNDDETKRVYDEEGMREEFEYKMNCIIKNAGL
jgi:ribosomal protein L31